MVHSASSSLADDYYNYTAGDLTPTESSTADAYYLDDQHHPQRQQNLYPVPPHGQAHTQSLPGHIKKQASLANIAVPSFSAFRSQASSIPISSPNKPNRLAGTLLASPRPTSFSAAEQPSPRLAEPTSRPLSLDSPLPLQPSGLANELSPPLTENTLGKAGERSSYSRLPAHSRAVSIDSRLADAEPVSSRPLSISRRSSIPVHSRYSDEQVNSHVSSHAPKQSVSSIGSASQYSPVKGSSLRPSMISHQQAPSMTLQFNGVQRTLSDESLSTNTSEKRPKSPTTKGLGAFFGWRSSPQKSGTESPTTTFSDRSLSPAPSPHLHKPSQMESNGGSARLTPPGLDIHKANAHASAYYDHPSTPIMLQSPESNAHVHELEQELTHISEELASSIRREMELEDELERLKLEMPSFPASENGRRSSDYFSDSGASSSKFPISDPEAKIEELERLRRKAEQEKAQMQADNSQKLQFEMTRRRELEQLAQSLEEQLHEKTNDAEERMYLDEKLGELEANLDETKRRLGQEKQAKNNFEDLYSATREELEQRRNERDNLRDEILPQLKCRLEGLEAEAVDTQVLVYENTRLQQEVHALKEEQKLFHEAHRTGQYSVFGRIAEEDDDDDLVSPGLPRTTLSRSGSLARSGSKRGMSLTRSGSIKDGQGSKQRSGSMSGGHSGPLGPEGQKEIEDQRDALHKALKLLISRYEKQQRDHQRAMKKLTTEKSAAELHASNTNPKRSQYQREVSFLKDEVATLRKRTEDALDQKWEYEKGLSGIKMDLDRAENETRGLRALLQEHDILAPGAKRGSRDQDEKLGVTIANAESERDQARQVAEAYRQRALDMQETSSAASDDQSPAVTQLFDSANRMDDLAEQLEDQVQANSALRTRLTEAVQKGEREQKESTRQIEEMQSRLAGLEDSVLAAQQHSETTLSTHETEVRRIEEASSPALQRLTIHIPSPTKLSPLTSPLLRKSPRLGSKKLSETSLLEMSRTQMLERKVREMEGLLREAEQDMQAVVQRVNRSQFEVAELTGERDAAFTQMRKLQALVVEERERAEGLL